MTSIAFTREKLHQLFQAHLFFMGGSDFELIFCFQSKRPFRHTVHTVLTGDVNFFIFIFR